MGRRHHFVYLDDTNKRRTNLNLPAADFCNLADVRLLIRHNPIIINFAAENQNNN